MTGKPISAHAVNVLKGLAAAPSPAQWVNAGVCWKLTREGLAEYVQLPSPFASHKGRLIAHLRITDAGRARIADG